MLARILLILCMIGVLSSACQWLAPDTQLQMKDIHYADASNTVLDVYLPADGDGPYPTVLLVHGTDMDKDYFQGTSTIDDLLSHGYAAVSVEYRPSTLSDLLISLSDIACALGWVYANSDTYQLNTSTIAALGHSRGASLVTLLAARDDISAFLEGCHYTLPAENWIHGVIAYAGSFGTPAASFSDPYFTGVFSAFLNLSAAETEAIFTELSQIPPAEWLSSDALPAAVRQYISAFPIAWVDGTEPPFLIIQGETDEIVSPQEAPAFDQALRQAGVDSELFIVSAGFHRLNQAAIRQPLYDFLARIQR